uniref:uncharacterized protein LOC100178181 isoform X3 n=1 Tax=Ciona intestinalis TaxID=7719 RepID=UPI0005212B45|nr:uncharacterized protein LOC100178181 isoform X3 [Ciona intestinalis]|eukprot:XP_002119583.2 uncharacterized protein LOC100178181 isoform X3 [Ciona intestinalis]
MIMKVVLLLLVLLILPYSKAPDEIKRTKRNSEEQVRKTWIKRNGKFLMDNCGKHEVYIEEKHKCKLTNLTACQEGGHLFRYLCRFCEKDSNGKETGKCGEFQRPEAKENNTKANKDTTDKEQRKENLPPSPATPGLLLQITTPQQRNQQTNRNKATINNRTVQNKYGQNTNGSMNKTDDQNIKASVFKNATSSSNEDLAKPAITQQYSLPPGIIGVITTLAVICFITLVLLIRKCCKNEQNSQDRQGNGQPGEKIPLNN